MLIRDKRHFTTGVIMAVSFFRAFRSHQCRLFSVKGMNGLEFSDDMFNKLSKGSAYFIPKIAKQNETYVGKQIEAKVKYDKPDDAKKAGDLIALAGGKSELNAAN